MATKKEENKRKIELNQDFMLIDKKKDAHRGSYRHLLKTRQPIDLGKIQVALSREFYQASSRIEGFLTN